MADKERKTAMVFAVNVSQQKSTPKTTVPEITVVREGILNDAHAGPGQRQLSLLAKESIDGYNSAHNTQLGPGHFGENITCLGINLQQVRELDRLIIGTAELEVSQLSKPCQTNENAARQAAGTCLMDEKGIFLRVIKPGRIKPGDKIIHFPRIFQFKVILLRQDGIAGEHEVRINQEIEASLTDCFRDTGRRIEIQALPLRNHPEELKAELLSLVNAAYDVIFTSGGTGLGPGDIVPDIVQSVCDKMIPGVMDAIRNKYGQENAHALLSRSVAGIIKQTMVFTLPGCPRAVKEYLQEITKLLAHMILAMHGLKH